MAVEGAVDPAGEAEGNKRTVNLREVINGASCVLGHPVASDPDRPDAVS
jgi:hypothetical protein